VSITGTTNKEFLTGFTQEKGHRLEKFHKFGAEGFGKDGLSGEEK